MISRQARSLRSEASSATLEMCSVRVGNTLFGISITHILEIVGRARPTPVPLAPHCIGGLLHYRGEVLTTVSLRRLLGLSDRESAGEGANVGTQDILVLENPGGCFGLLVDSVGEVIAVSTVDYEPNPSILDERRSALFAGTYKLRQGLLVVLDTKLLDPVRLNSIQTQEAS